jgi:hypothetical protein
MKTFRIISFLLPAFLGMFFGILNVYSQGTVTSPKTAVSDQKDIVPSMATWSMRKDIIDLAAKNTPFRVLTSLRGAGNNLDHFTDEVHDQFKMMQEYAAKEGISLVADLDVRMALNSYEKKYPDELQQMLALKEVDLKKENNPDVVIRCRTLSDHYKNPYLIRSGSFVKAYAYSLNSNGLIDPSTLTDISKNCKVISATKELVEIKIPDNIKQSKVMVMVSFTILYPDVFSKSVIDFQRELIRKYADIPLAGTLKDEWGFPPSLSEETIFSDYWYSKNREKAYAERTGGRELLSDILLMAKGIQGKENERLMAINHFNEMCWQRNGEIEDDFYHAVKKAWGTQAIVAVHPTWYPYPERREFKKNGLDWWIATRDLGQTDEIVPYGARTSLAKKWGNKVWYNMDHTMGLPPQTIIDADIFVRNLWSSALAGGRINNLPIDVRPEGIVGSDYIRAETRVHLLNYINPAPLDCPVAVIFGHTSAMNWAGSGFDDVGMKLVDSLWRRGIPADLIPSSEIWNKSLKIDKDGYISYGSQRYAAVVLYNPEFEKQSTADFFNNASKGKTRLFRVGDWKKDFNGKDFNGNTALLKTLIESEFNAIIAEMPEILEKQGIPLQTPATRDLEGFGHSSPIPPATGFCRLVDGTLIQVAGTNNGAGDPIKSTMKIGKYNVSFDAVGVAAARLDKNGKLEALAASELKSFELGDFKINLDKRIDLALWHNEKGEWEGVVQGLQGDIPPQLQSLTNKWARIDLPAPYPQKEKVIIKSAIVKEADRGNLSVTGIVKDIDGNTYNIVKIGNQVWMTGNLRTGRYNDGKSLSGNYTWYDNDSVKYNLKYGKLYSGFTLISKNLCPSGWHVPTADEWINLIEYLKGNDNKSFNPVAGGYKWGFGNNFVSLGKNGNWWSSSGLNKRVAWNRETQSLYYIEDRGLSAEYGLSVRCIKDGD